MIFEILGDPIAQKRHRMTVRGKHPHAYDPCEKDKDDFSFKVHQKLIDMYNESKESSIEAAGLLTADYYILDFEYHLSFPKTWKTKEINQYLWGLRVCDDNKDFDNLCKFTCDAVKDQLLKDDRYVIKGSSTKFYSFTPKTVIKIMAKKNVSFDDKATDILSMIPPEEFIKLQMALCDMYILLQSIKHPERLCEKVFDEDSGDHKQQLSSTAYTLSYLADHFGPILSKISKKHPRYWEECLERDTRINDSFRDGKTIC